MNVYGRVVDGEVLIILCNKDAVMRKGRRYLYSPTVCRWCWKTYNHPPYKAQSIASLLSSFTVKVSTRITRYLQGFSVACLSRLGYARQGVTESERV